MAAEDAPTRIKRFTHKSYEARLKDVHAPSALAQTSFDQDLEDDQSHFYEALQHWRQMNLSPTFIKFSGQADTLSSSMPLIVHHWKQILELWLESLKEADDEALRALLDLMQKLLHDLRSTLAPSYDAILAGLLRLLSRRLSPEALTALLASFSAIFKYLLIPSTDLETFSHTWTSLCPVLRICNPEVQRAFAEVWGTVLRRLKSSSRKGAMELMCDGLEGIEDACAWSIVFACKSVSQTVHTASSSIIAPLLDCHIHRNDASATRQLLRRILTALIHHCKGPEQFSPVAEVLIERFSAVVGNPEGIDLTRTLEVVSMVTSVRQGSRLSANQLVSIASKSLSLVVTQALHETLLPFHASILVAGDMALWMSAGRKIVEDSWSDPIYGMRLCAVLSDLNWGGWKLLELPQIQNRVPTLLDSHTADALDLLAALYKKRRLADADQSFRQKVGVWTNARLSNWKLNVQTVEELQQVLAFSSILPTFSPTLVAIIESLLNTDDPRLESIDAPANSTWALGSSLRALASRTSTTWEPLVDMTAWSTHILRKWPWSETVMHEFVLVVKATHVSKPFGTFDEIYELLSEHILSHSHLLRQSIIELFATNAIRSTSSEHQLIDKLLEAERATLDVQGARDRTLRITRLPQLVPEGDSTVSQLAIRWLVAQLKVNLRPIWTPTAKTLATLSERCGDTVWRIVHDELSGIVKPVNIMSRPEKTIFGHDEVENLDDVREEERSWRDPSAHKVRSAVALWTTSAHARCQANRLASLRPRDRFDPQSYEAQLLATLNYAASLAEKHNRDLVPLFLSLGGDDGPIQLPRIKLAAWLSLFSKFANPKTLHSAARLHSLYIRLLSHPDRSLQTVALSCLLTYKSPHLLLLENTFRMLLDDTRWRDELTNLDVTSLSPDDRAEVVDVLIRLLFGVMLEKKGRSRGGDRRSAVLNALGACTDDELDLLVRLMLQSLTPGLANRLDSEIFTVSNVPADLPYRQQLGFLHTLTDVMRSLGTRLLHRWEPLIRITVSITANAQAAIGVSKTVVNEIAEEDEEEGAVESEDTPSVSSTPKTLRSIRQQGLKRLTDFFRAEVSFEFRPLLPLIFQSLVSPRLAFLDRENSQSPSALLELFLVWGSRVDYAPFLVEYDDRVLPQLYACLVAPAVKPPVVSRVLDLVERLLSFADEDDNIAESVMKPHVSTLLSNLGTLISTTKYNKAADTPLLAREASILSRLSKYITDGAQATTFLTLFLPLLRKPNRIIGEHMKVDILGIVSSLIPFVPDMSDPTSASYKRTYEALAACFQSLRSRAARVALLAAFRPLSEVDVSLRPLADLFDGLNAYSTKRLEEPDFDRRLESFMSLNKTMYSSLSASQWLPIMYNMLCFIQDPNELAIRTSSSESLKLFIDGVAARPDSDYQLIFLRKLYPALKHGLRSRNEMVRAEVLGVVAYAVHKCQHLATLQDMRVLLADGDEEASFFNNIHHVQLHRRVRALRRLCEFCESGQLHASSLADIFVPLIGNFITSAATVDHQLVNAAISATGAMARTLPWGPYIALVNQYLKLSRTKDSLQRTYIRTLVSVLDNFHFPMTDAILAEPSSENEDQAVEGEEDDPSGNQVLATRIEEAVNDNLLPALLRFLEDRNEESDDSIRLPISIGIVKVAQHLPEATRETQIGRLLTILSQVFRSKSSDTRDIARETLCRVAVILGAPWLPIILRELRTALTRGPHIHILGFVTHALLVHVTSEKHAGTFPVLDACVPDVAHIASEVVFGEPGKDVQSEGFKTKVKEVRSSSSKGLDSFAIMASHITPRKISGLLLPLRGVMQETEALKTMQLVDDVLRRIASGLNSNKHLIPTELLVLCHTLISQNARFLQDAPSSHYKPKKRSDAVVQVKRQQATAVNHYATNSFRFVTLGLDLFVTGFRRGRFDFNDNKTISRLEPMVAVIGNTLYATNSHVLMQGLKASSAILKCPLTNIDKSLPVFIKQTIVIIQQIGSTDSDVVQTALKTLSTLLRERSTAKIGEKDLLYLLELLSPDIEDPTRQASVFAMLRAIVTRRFVVPEIYDLMERVGEVMITSQSTNVQELCRGVMLQFLLDYPQGKGRLKHQMAFFTKNLSYVYETGRHSVMELLSAIIAKFNEALIEEYADMIFVALVMVLANDEAKRCREMAAELIKALLRRVGEEHQRGLMTHLHSWAAQHTQATLSRVACQVYGLTLEMFQAEALPYLPTLLEDVNKLISRSRASLDRAEEATTMDVDVEWQVPYQACATLEKLLRAFPDKTRSLPWSDIVAHLLFPHAWVRMASSRLVGLLLSHQTPDAPRPDFPAEAVDVKDIAEKLCLQLRSDYLDEPLSLQIVKNLFWVGKCFCAIPAPVHDVNAGNDGDSDYTGDEVAIDSDADDGDKDRPENPLAWLFSKLSYQARSAHIARRNRTANEENWRIQLSAIFRWFAAMSTFMASDRLSCFLMHILSPVYRIVEEIMIKDPHLDALKSTAIELQDLLQQKVGSTDFAATYAKIRSHILEVQRERRVARVTLDALNPEAAARRKAHQADIKKGSRKRKDSAYADRKGRLKRAKNG